ncbi:MAG: UDP-N-acetylmuramoyl-tripeptide--D-alanyl-D-alanine ligase [Oscillospiraceae bacterium]|jgi:UDP-N-acetylmuramoyl-tripeptide--D-alanyl-D-alanine ligase
MEELTLYEIIKAIDGSFGYPSTEIVTSISTDTRKISNGSVFFALKGESFDGHDFVLKAIELGAVAAVTEKAIDGARCIIVDSVRKALLDIAAYYRSRFSPVIVGVTGSVGKTTTKEMISLVLSSKLKTLKTAGNLNNEIGLPLTLLELNSEHEAAVIEMGMSGFGEISKLSMCAKPTIGVITNIGYSHIQNLGSREGILKAKLEILDGMPPDASIILNGDDDMLLSAKEAIGKNTIYYAMKNHGVDVFASDVKIENSKTYFNINFWGKKLSAVLNCVGEHNVMNALAAFCVGITADIEAEKIIEAISQFIPEGLRQTIVRKGGQTVIIDCYNASPDSMKASLAVLSELSPMPGGRRIAVLGDMLELGSMSDELHSKVGDYVFASKADILVCFGEASLHIKNSAEKSEKISCHHFTDRKKAVDFLKSIIIKNDLLLFKASRAMKLETIIDALYQDR